MYTAGAWQGPEEGGNSGGPKAYTDLAFIVIDVVLIFFLNIWLSAMVGRARKVCKAPSHPAARWRFARHTVAFNFVLCAQKYGVDYPNMYAYRTMKRDGHVYKHVPKDEESLMVRQQQRPAATP